MEKKENFLKRILWIWKEEDISFSKTICILILLMVLSAFFGFIYETIFYRIDLGYFVKRGSTFGPWIPIYAFGGFFIALISYRFRKNPLFVFFINCLVTGILEYGTGYVLYEFWGVRLWDYNTEIWNFGNIDGFICLRSILFFGISSLFLIYIVIPFLKRLTEKIPSPNLSIVAGVLGILFVLDIALYHFIGA